MGTQLQPPSPLLQKTAPAAVTVGDNIASKDNEPCVPSNANLESRFVYVLTAYGNLVKIPSECLVPKPRNYICEVCDGAFTTEKKVRGHTTLDCGKSMSSVTKSVNRVRKEPNTDDNLQSSLNKVVEEEKVAELVLKPKSKMTKTKGTASQSPVEPPVVGKPHARRSSRILQRKKMKRKAEIIKRPVTELNVDSLERLGCEENKDKEEIRLTQSRSLPLLSLSDMNISDSDENGSERKPVPRNRSDDFSSTDSEIERIFKKAETKITSIPDNAEQLLSRMKLPSNKKSRKTFSCDLCKYSCGSFGGLELHLKSKHEVQGPFGSKSKVTYKCDKCSFVTSNLERFDYHRKKHKLMDNFEILEDGGIRCKLCGDTSQRTESFTRSRHLSEKHSAEVGDRNLLCPVCGKSFCFQNSLAYHMLHSHKSRKRSQNFSKDEENEDASQNGILSVFFCEKCKLNFSHRDDFNQHIKESHLGDFKHNTSKKYHIKCKHCGLFFTHSRAFSQHLREIHADLYTFKCKFCNASYIYEQVLKNHELKKHTGLTETVNKLN